MTSTLRSITLFLGLMLAGCGDGGGSEPVAAAPAPAPVQIAPAPAPIAAPPAAPASLVLGTATQFGQGSSLSALQVAKTIGSANVRDGITWTDVETAPGVYDFSSPRVSYIGQVLNAGTKITLLFQGGNPHYDNGYTPYTDAGRAAFANFIVATLDHFPGLATIEIGNEYNANNFVTGPVQAAGYGQRQIYYAAMLKAVHARVKARHPAVRILGGAALAIPVGYYSTLFAQGALDTMDGIVVHPYTTDPEQLERQLAMLRSAMGSHPVPIHATEFSLQSDSTTDTANYLVKMVTALSSAGVASADWFALQQQGPPGAIWYKNAALSTIAGTLTPSGQAFQLMSTKLLAQGDAKRVATDSMTYAYNFGPNAMVLWGAARSVSYSGQARFYSVLGQEIAAPTMLSPDTPIVMIGTSPIVFGTNVVLGASRQIADSYDDFDYMNGSTNAWSYYEFNVNRQAFERLSSQGGGEISSSYWTPYIGSPYIRPLSIDPHRVNPVDFGTAASPNVFKPDLRYTVQESGSIDLSGRWTVEASSQDGIDVSILLNGRVIGTAAGTGTLTLDLTRIAVTKGDVIDVVTGTNRTVLGGDETVYRIRIYRSA